MSKFPIILGTPPASWPSELSCRVHSGISECIIRTIEPVGHYFLAHARRKLHNHSFSEDQRIQDATQTAAIEEDIHEDSEEETLELLNRDPKEWKDQDHYAVLGLSNFRWKATDEQIKLAYRKKVLKHHPDKKASSGNTNDDAFFKCIQKAHEILSDPTKRRQYDSVDIEIDDSPPSLKLKGDFFEIYRPVFEREARFSNKTPVPPLGDINTTKEDLEAFYDFWYNFDSWRSFEYLDKEDADSTDNRDDKRYLERKNKTERTKRKKDDIARLRKIVDNALLLDPRIQKYKQEEKAAKEAKKKEKEEAAKRVEEEAKKAVEEQKKKQEEAEAEAKQKQLEEKKGKAAKKKAIRNERKNIKNIVKEQNYFYPEGEIAPVDVIEVQLSELDILLESQSVEELQQLKENLVSATSKNEAKRVMRNEVARLLKAGILSAGVIIYFNPVPGEEDSPVAENLNGKENEIIAEKNNVKKGEKEKKFRDKAEWSVEEISMLIKAANKFPGGTVNRWETISDYVALHTGLPSRTNEELIHKSNEVKKGGVTALDEEAVRKLQHQKKHADTRISEDPSMREATINYDDPVHLNDERIKDEKTSKNKLSKKKNKSGSTFTSKNPSDSSSKSAEAPISSGIAPDSIENGEFEANEKFTIVSPMSSKLPDVVSLQEGPKPSTVDINSTEKPINSQSSTLVTQISNTLSASSVQSWTAAQQSQLERALQAYPSTWKGSGERWDNIAAAVEGKTKKECRLRVKYLTEQVKAKKAITGGK
ncbi:hypothetical protein G9A89_021960 [Geosiphon pyriformis]|nr:hypothetical protein G9A89_021960 [Geosiphon pyriformis]